MTVLLCDTAGRSTITREEISRWERGVRVPSRYWLPHLASVLKTPLETLETERMKRRQFLKLAATVPMVGDMPGTAGDLMASIASGDAAPLCQMQTSHQTDLTVSALASTDLAGRLRLAQWMRDGESDVLRVNAAGILAKMGVPELLDKVSLCLQHDAAVRQRYVTALVARAGHSTARLATEVTNPHDSGARWCSAWLLGRGGSHAARSSLTRALRHEPVRENLRTIGLLLNGEDPCR